MAQEKDQTATRAKRQVTVGRGDLPLHCPMPQSTLWNLHPKVFIPLKAGETESALCPYCGTLYLLNKD